MKKLYKSRSNRVVFGVCSGFAEYLDIDPVVVRILFILTTLFGGMGILAYIIGAIIIPEKSDQTEATASNPEVIPDNQAETPPPLPKRDRSGEIVGLILVTFGIFFMLKRLAFLDRYIDWISYHFWGLMLPLMLLSIGVALIIRSKK